MRQLWQLRQLRSMERFRTLKAKCWMDGWDYLFLLYLRFLYLFFLYLVLPIFVLPKFGTSFICSSNICASYIWSFLGPVLPVKWVGTLLFVFVFILRLTFICICFNSQVCLYLYLFQDQVCLYLYFFSFSGVLICQYVISIWRSVPSSYGLMEAIF